MAFAEMYFDESEASEQKLLCVSGCIFTKERCVLLEGEWGSVLRREGLPYFRMVDCAHGNGVFRDFAKDRRIKIQTELIDLLKLHMARGISVTFDLRFVHLCPTALTHGITQVTPYTMCCWFCLMEGQKWAKKTGFDGEISYFFESGHPYQLQANHMLNEISSVAWTRSFYRYAAHAFLPKERAIPLQCADILAWQWTKYKKDCMAEKTTMRADLRSLLQNDQQFTMHFDEATLMEFRQIASEANQASP